MSTDGDRRSRSRRRRRRNLALNTVAVDVGCNCRKPRLFLTTFFHRPTPKPPSNPSTTTTTTTTSLTHSSSASSSHDDYHHHQRHYYDHSTSSSSSLQHLLEAEADVADSAKSVQGFGRIDSEGVAVEKVSDDPYLDFRHSMLQMILENHIYSRDDLRELLNCFLQLNSPYYHGVIVRAFTEIWNHGVFSLVAPHPHPSSFGYTTSSWEI